MTKKLKANKAGYYIYKWYDDVYYIADVWNGIEYVTKQPQIFYRRSPEISITPHVRKEPDLDALVVAIMLMVDDIDRENHTGKCDPT